VKLANHSLIRSALNVQVACKILVPRKVDTPSWSVPLETLTYNRTRLRPGDDWILHIYTDVLTAEARRRLVDHGYSELGWPTSSLSRGPARDR
jgi:hypothetical protein